jgi:hypothetical protein
MSFGETESSMSLPSKEVSAPPPKVSVRSPRVLIAETWHRPLFLTRDRWFETGSLLRRVRRNGVLATDSVSKSPGLRWPVKHLPSLTSRDRAINMLEAKRLDAPARFKDAYCPELRAFGPDAPEIAPPAADEVRDLGLEKLGKGAADVAPSMSGNAEKGTNAARQADGGSAVDRQKLEHAEKSVAPHASRRSASRGALTGS